MDGNRPPQQNQKQHGRRRMRNPSQPQDAVRVNHANENGARENETPCLGKNKDQAKGEGTGYPALGSTPGNLHEASPRGEPNPHSSLFSHSGTRSRPPPPKIMVLRQEPEESPTQESGRSAGRMRQAADAYLPDDPGPGPDPVVYDPSPGRQA